MISRTPAQQAAQEVRDQEVMDQEMALAERRGADRVRAQVRAVLDERRRVVRQGEQQIEVVEVSALTELLADESP